MRSFLAILTVAAAGAMAEAVQPPAVITPTDNLVVDGVPAIPAALADSVRPYTESRAASFVEWHPARLEMLISTRFANTPQLHLVRMPGGDRKQLTFFSEPVGNASWEPTEGRYFVFGKDVGGNEFSQLFRFDIATGAVTLLTDGGRSQNGGVVWNNAKTQFLYSTTRRNGADRDLWIMDPMNPQDSKPIAELTGGGWAGLDWSPDDSQIAAIESLSVNKTNLWLINVASGAMTAVTPVEEQVAWGGAEFSHDGRSLYLTSDRDGEFQRLAKMDLKTKELQWLTSGIPWDVDGFELSPDGSKIALLTNEAGISRAYLMETANHELKPVAGIPTGVIGAASWHEDGEHIAFTVNSARSTSDVFVYAVSSGQLARWTESELGGLVADRLVEPELIRWSSFDGLEITGFKYPAAPQFTGKRPVIINIHGGPEGQSLPVFQGRNNYYMNELGVTMIYPNVRGSTGYGKTYVAMDNGMKREDSVKDIGALLDWIATQPDLDADRVMVTGGSYGGYMTLACATHFNERLRCSLDVVGISHFATFLKNTESYRRDLRRVEYGDERDPAMMSFFEQIAPLNNAHKITKPLFVVQGGNDPRVPLSEAEQMVAKVKSNGSPVWYLMATDEGHGFRKKSNADFQFYATIEFVRTHLLP